MCRLPKHCLFFICVLAPGQPAAEEIIRKSLDRDNLNRERLKDYTFVQRVEQREFRGDGKTKKSKSTTFDVVLLDETSFRKKIAENDKPLSDKERRKVETAIKKARQERESESESARRKRIREQEDEREEMRSILREIPDAFDLKLLGTDSVDGFAAWLVEATPRPAYKPKSSKAGLLKKFKGKIWIDQKELQWVRVEAETIDTVSFGWFLARLAPGATLSFEQRRVNSEVWLPSRISTQANLRLALLKKFDGEIEITYRDYKKFRTDSRVVSTEELVEPAR